MTALVNQKEKIKTQFKSIVPSYEKLAENIRNALLGFLNEKQIDLVDIKIRVKTFDSFCDKTERKGYKYPFNEIEDICGVRIIHYYMSDFEKISKIISTEFNVMESVNKIDLMDPDRFGYRSQHFVVSIKEGWLQAPNYRGSDGLKAEIQVRTILMHSWAAISHKLSYKKEEDIPRELRRRLFRLSALIELADEQFDHLKAERDNYAASLISKDGKGNEQFDDTKPLNIDSLRTLLNYHCPGRKKPSEQGISSLLNEMNENDITLKDINEGFIKLKHFFPEMEKDYFKAFGEGIWAQAGIARAVMQLINTNYWKDRKKFVPKKVCAHRNRWKEKLEGII